MRISDWSSDVCSSDLLISLVTIIENLLDRHGEQPCQLEGERQRGVVFSCLDRIHRLARDIEPVGKPRLAPVSTHAQHLELVVHRISLPSCVHDPMSVSTAELRVEKVSVISIDP